MTGKMKLNTVEKISHRLETLKKEDSLLNYDIIEHFWVKMEELKVKLNLPNLEPVAQCLSEENYRHMFLNLTSGNY